MRIKKSFTGGIIGSKTEDFGPSSFFKQKGLANGLREIPQETKVAQANHEQQSNGTVLISPTTNVCCRNLLSSLELEGFTLVSCWFQKGDRPNGQKNIRVRFVFVPNEVATLDPRFCQQEARQALVKLTTEALWRVRAYLNPENGGQQISINLEMRSPQINGLGKTILVSRRSLGTQMGFPVVLSEPA